MKNLLLLLIRLYQLGVSPLLGCHCRFQPSCSHYCAQALTAHGVFKGSLLGLRRLLRCNPFFSSGFDPVPEQPINIIMK